MGQVWMFFWKMIHSRLSVEDNYQPWRANAVLHLYTLHPVNLNFQISKVFEVAERFFKLPSEEKQQFATEFSATNYHGWMAQGREM